MRELHRKSSMKETISSLTTSKAAFQRALAGQLDKPITNDKAVATSFVVQTKFKFENFEHIYILNVLDML